MHACIKEPYEKAPYTSRLIQTPLSAYTRAGSSFARAGARIRTHTSAHTFHHFAFLCRSSSQTEQSLIRVYADICIIRSSYVCLWLSFVSLLLPNTFLTRFWRWTRGWDQPVCVKGNCHCHHLLAGFCRFREMQQANCWNTGRPKGNLSFFFLYYIT